MIMKENRTARHEILLAQIRYVLLDAKMPAPDDETIDKIISLVEKDLRERMRKAH